MTVLLLLVTALGIAGLLLGTLVAGLMRLTWRAAFMAALACLWVAAYGVVLLAVSLRSHERVLAAGETKRFCGFYLDCHLGVAVLADSVTQTVSGRPASGTFHVLTLQISSNAVRETLTPYDLRLEVVGEGGRLYQRDRNVEAALGVGGPLERPVAAGASYVVRVVFDLPGSLSEPRLLAYQGGGFPERVLIDDELSFLHRRTLLALPRAR